MWKVEVRGEETEKNIHYDTPDSYFALQGSIQDMKSLQEATRKIIGEVNARWRPLKAMKIFEYMHPDQIAYANQILCRTTVPARELEYGDRTSFEAIYNNCFNNRILSLIRILKPDAIIALGDKADNP